MSMQRAKRREESTKGASTIRRRTQDAPPPTHTRLLPLNPPTIPPQMTYTRTPTQVPHPPKTPPPQAPPLYQTDPLPLPKNTHTPRPSPSTQPRPKYPSPENPHSQPHTPLTALPPSPPPKKKKTHWRGGVSLRSRSGHPGVGSWGAETNPPLGGHPGVGAKSGGEGRRPPSFQLTTRNKQGTRQPNRHNSKCRTRPDGGHVSV